MQQDIISDAELLDRIRAFCVRHEMKPTAFGRSALGDGSLISNLEAGRSLTLRNAARVAAFMSTYQSDTAAAA